MLLGFREKGTFIFFSPDPAGCCSLDLLPTLLTKLLFHIGPSSLAEKLSFQTYIKLPDNRLKRNNQ